MATLTREGLSLTYEVTGSGPALVLPQCNFSWSDLLDVAPLAEHFMFIIASPRGSAGSGRLAADLDYRVTDFADDLVAMVEAAPLFAFWGEEDEEIEKADGAQLLAVGLDQRGLPHESFPGYDHEGLLAHIDEAIPAVLAWLDH